MDRFCILKFVLFEYKSINVMARFVPLEENVVFLETKVNVFQQEIPKQSSIFELNFGTVIESNVSSG